MKIVIADSSENMAEHMFREVKNKEIAFLASYFYLNLNNKETRMGKTLSKLASENPESKPDIYMDSGVFSARKRDILIPSNELAEYYLKNNHVYNWVFNMDEGTHEEQLENCKTLKNMGVPVIGIYHADMPLDYLLRFYEISPYIAISFFKLGGPHSKQVKNCFDNIFAFLFKHFSVDKFPKIHALGTERYDILSNYPFYSADSTGAKSQYAYGRHTVNDPITKQPKSVGCSEREQKKYGFNSLKGLGSTRDKLDIRVVASIKARINYNKHLTELWKKRGITWE